MKRAVLYCRVSRSTDESVSVDRQERELRELAHSEGWQVVTVFTDDGFSGRVEREKANSALDMIAEGQAEVLLVWEMSRWSRMGLSAVARLVAVLDERPGTLFVTKVGGLRSDSPLFGVMASVIAEVSKMEAESTRARILSMRSHLLSTVDPKEQRWLGGAVPMGYQAVDRDNGPGRRLVIDSYEAGYMRAAARKLVNGAGLTEVTRWFNDEGVATPQSAARRARQAGKATEGLSAGLWRVTTIRKLFQSPTLLGRTTKQTVVGTRSDGSPIIDYRVVTDDQGMPIQRWEPLLEAGVFAAVQERFTARGPNAPRKAASWLSGLLYCELCGSVLYSNSRSDRVTSSFRCANRATPGQQCPGVSVSRGQAEEFMEATILRMVGALPEYKVTETIEGADTGALDSVAQSIADLQVALAADSADYGALLPRLDALKETRRTLLAAPGKLVRTKTPTGRSFADAWGEASIAEKQFMVGDMLDSITVLKPTKHGRQNTIQERLNPIWIEHPEVED